MKRFESRNVQLAWTLVLFALVIFVVTLWKFRPL